MKKKLGIITVVIIVVMLVTSAYWFYGREGAELSNSTTKAIEQDDFILHIGVERIDEGFQVLRAIQYVGKGSVEITHQTPLISVSFKQRNHDYTGSTVSRTLNTGTSYHPQNSKTFAAPEEGDYTLFCEANFTVNGEHMTISHQEELTFY